MADRKILIKTGIKLSVFVVIFLLFDFLAIPRIVLLLNEHFDLRQYYCRVESADIIVLGDSHTSFAISPDVLRKKGHSCMNYSKGGHYNSFNYFFYKVYREKFKKPEFAIVSVPVFFLKAPDFEDLPRLTGSEGLRIMIEESSLDPASYAGMVGNLEVNLYKYRFALTEGVFWGLYGKIRGTGNRKALYTPIGYATNTNSSFRTETLLTNKRVQEIEKNWDGRYIDYPESDFYINSDENREKLRYFVELLDLLNKDGVKVLLVETPEYISTLRYVKNREDFYKGVSGIAAEYSNVVFIPQYEIKSIDNSKPELFFDGGKGVLNSHLSFEGSILYTEELYDRYMVRIDANRKADLQ